MCEYVFLLLFVFVCVSLSLCMRVCVACVFMCAAIAIYIFLVPLGFPTYVVTILPHDQATWPRFSYAVF